MKPIRLTLENFGPFAESQTVDFTLLDEIFLISGPTGSGKTSLFDGMVYALYGELPGTRDPLRIKSNYSSDEGTAKVSLEFRARSKEFRIERSLIVSRNRKGELNTRKDQALFELKGAGEKEVAVPETSKISELNRFVVDLLHLSKEEFSKIILLPQGEFQKFLEEDSKGRQAIMRKLFPTEEHVRITEIIAEKKRIKNQELRTAQAQLDELEESLDLENLEANETKLKKEIAALEEDRAELKKKMEALVRQQEQENAIARRFEEKEKYLKEEALLLEKQGQMDALRNSVSMAEKASGLVPYINELERLAQELDQYEARRTLVEKQKDELHQKEKSLSDEIQKRESLSSQRQNIQIEIGELQPLVEKESRLSELTGKLAELEKQEVKGSESIEAMEKDMVEVLESLKSCDEQLEAQESSLEDSDSLYDILSQHRGRLEALDAALREFGMLQEKAKERDAVQKTVAINERNLRLLEDSKNQSMAAGLAVQLSEGKPCPVCGSTDHPAPAHLDTSPFTEEEELDTARNNLEQSRSQLAGIETMMREHARQLIGLSIESPFTAVESKETSAGKSSASRKGSKREGMKSLLSSALGIAKEDELEKKQDLEIDRKALDFARDEAMAARSAEEQEVISLETRLQESRKLKDAIQKLRIRRKELQKSEDELRIALSRLTEEKQSLRSEIASLRSTMESLQQDLAGRSSIAKQLEELRSQSAELETEMAAIDLKEKELMEAKTANSASLEATDQQLKLAQAEKQEREKKIETLRKKTKFKSLEEAKQAAMDEDSLTAKKEELAQYDRRKEQIRTLLESLNKELAKKIAPDLGATVQKIQELTLESDSQEKELEATRSNLEELLRQKNRRTELQDRIDQIQKDNLPLFQLADDLAGFNHRKVNFENFVLNYYLRDVTNHANQRLSRLSDGRYALVVSAEVEHGNRQTGLNLDILDAHTGIPRSVKSLSGGEKFLASLALALGLADVIQERAGTIEMDSLFLDEGFGTLDEEALNRAMTILEEIRENRMVGIISHVSELKRTIPCQIQVKKSSAGSSVHLVRN